MAHNYLVNKMKNYLISLIGAICISALRIFDKANIVSVILLITGLSMLLYALRHASKKREYIYIAILFSVTYVIRFFGYTEGTILNIILGIAIGLIMFIVMAFECMFKKYDHCFWYVLIFPIIYAVFMCFTEITKINMPFRFDSYFSCFRIFCQITSLFGIYILDFLLALTVSVIVFVIDHKKTRTSKTIITTYLLMICLILGFDFLHLNKKDKEESLKNNVITIACATGPNGYIYDNYLKSPTLEENITILTEDIKEALENKAEILIFSEESFCVKDKEEETLLENAKSLAYLNNISICLAYETEDTDNDLNGKGENKLCFISDKGEILCDYTKYNIIPFIETADYIKGDRKIESFEADINGKTINIACAICYDMDYDFFMLSISKDTDILLVPTWDWKVIAEQHFDISRLRAISNNVTLVRSTYNGYNAVIDSTGNILAKDSTVNSDYGKIFVYNVPVK